MGTYLYIKTHNITGLKYFGKTTKPNPEKYRGSGKYWKRHIKTHGYDVTTEILGHYTNDAECSIAAIEFSKRHNITESNEWANLQDENGFDGAPVGHIGHKFTDDQLLEMSDKLVERWSNPEYKEKIIATHKARWTPELKEKQSLRLTGIARPEHSKVMTGKTKTEEQKINMRKPKHAGHGAKVSAAMKGKTKTSEHVRKIAMSRQRDKRVFIDHMGNKYELHSDFLNKFNIDKGFLKDMNSKVGTKSTFEKLSLSYDSDKHKTKTDLGFRFE